MRVLSLLLVVSCLAAYGCATAPEQAAKPAPASTSAAPANNVAQPQREARYRTGSRIPLSDESLGSENVSGSSREGYEEDRRNMVTPQKW